MDNKEVLLQVALDLFHAKDMMRWEYRKSLIKPE